MKFVEIYNRVITHWGEKIDFSDGAFLKPDLKNPGTTPTRGEPFESNTFSRQWEKVEESIGEDPFDELMVWTMYQVFHAHARHLFGKKVTTLKPISIAKAEIEEKYFQNLQEEGWVEELSVYERMID